MGANKQDIIDTAWIDNYNRDNILSKGKRL